MAFHEIQSPNDIAYGATGGPEFATSVVATASGYEQRNINWSAARGRWDVASGLKEADAARHPNRLFPRTQRPCVWVSVQRLDIF